jgi:hypothetical protein
MISECKVLLGMQNTMITVTSSSVIYMVKVKAHMLINKCKGHSKPSIPSKEQLRQHESLSNKNGKHT